MRCCSTRLLFPVLFQRRHDWLEDRCQALGKLIQSLPVPVELHAHPGLLGNHAAVFESLPHVLLSKGALSHLDAQNREIPVPWKQKGAQNIIVARTVEEGVIQSKKIKGIGGW